MSTNIIHELKKFLNNPQQITLEFSFLDFESSVFQGIRVVKELTTNKNVLTVILVKNKTLGSVSFFFRDGPTYQFALTVEEANLYNDNNSNESLISTFIVLGNDPIRGTQLKISSYSITIYACINDGKTRGLDSLSFNQIYSDCTSVKSYSYALGIETLKRPTYQKSIYQEPKKNNSNVPSKFSNIFLKNGIIFIVISSIVLLSAFFRESQKKNIHSDDFQENSNTTENDSLNIIENLVNKKSLKSEFKSDNLSNNNLVLNEINNVKKLNGFKNVKLGSALSIYSFENYPKKNAYLSDKYSRVNNYFNKTEIILGSGYVWSTKVEYINNKLVNIELTHIEEIENSFDLNMQKYVPDYRSHSLVNLYTRIFGEPTKVMLFDNSTFFNHPIYECFQENYQDCFSEFCNLSGKLEFTESTAISFVWKTDSVIYELILTSDSISRSGKKESDKMKECLEKVIPYYSREMSLIRIYSSEQDLLEKLKSLEKESYNIEYEQENNLKAKNNLKGI